MIRKLSHFSVYSVISYFHELYLFTDMNMFTFTNIIEVWRYIHKFFHQYHNNYYLVIKPSSKVSSKPKMTHTIKYIRKNVTYSC